jgi:hypothetical protein
MRARPLRGVIHRSESVGTALLAKILLGYVLVEPLILTPDHFMRENWCAGCGIAHGSALLLRCALILRPRGTRSEKLFWKALIRPGD